MATGIDTGNPNVYTTFKGRYELVPAAGQSVDTNVVMLSCTNDVQPLGDWTLVDYVGGTTFATLPAECRPGKEVMAPVVVDGTIEVMTVQTNGDMALVASHDMGVLYLSGINFNISDRWY